MTAHDQLKAYPPSDTDDVVTRLREQGDYERVMLHITRQMIWDGVANSSLFGDAVRSIAWDEKSPDFYLEVIHIALEVEAGLLARELANRGYERFPDDAELRKAAELLAPPKFIATTPAKPSLSPTMAWFQENSQHYRGRWVAVRNGQLIGDNIDYQSLMDTIGAVADDADMVITRVA